MESRQNMQVKIKFIRNLNTGRNAKKEYIFKIQKEKIDELHLQVGMRGWMRNLHAERKNLSKANRYNAVVKDNQAFSPFVITDIGHFDDKRHRRLIVAKIGDTLE